VQHGVVQRSAAPLVCAVGGEAQRRAQVRPRSRREASRERRGVHVAEAQQLQVRHMLKESGGGSEADVRSVRANLAVGVQDYLQLLLILAVVVLVKRLDGFRRRGRR
jgi:hypothetical protein